MADLLICAGCGNPFDPTRYGAGRRYCDIKCRHVAKSRKALDAATKTTRELLGRKRGRPRKYPVQTHAQEIVVLHDLHHCLNVQTVPIRDRDGNIIEYLYTGIRGPMIFRFAVGSANRRAVALADVMTYLNDQGDIQLVSACDQGKRYVPQQHKGTSIFLRAPCGRCHKCEVTNVLYLARREFNRKQIDAKKGLPPLPDLSIL